MSSRSKQPPLPSDSDCDQCPPSHPSSPSSSSTDSQQPSISVQFHPHPPRPDLSLHLLHEQIRQLKLQNTRLRGQTSKDRYKAEAHLLRDQLLQKEMEIQQLRQQLSSLDYGLPPSPKIEEKHYKLTKSSRKKRVATSSEEEAQDLRPRFSEKAVMEKLKRDKEDLEGAVNELEGKVVAYENELRWLVNLSGKVIGMATKLGYLFREKVLESHWSTRRQAKAAWRYVKHVLHHLLNVELPEK